MSDEDAFWGARSARGATSTFPMTAEEARAFTQRRISLWTRVVAVGVLVAHAALNGLLALRPEFPWTSWIVMPVTWLPLIPAALLGGLSLLCGARRARLSQAALSVVDAAALILFAACLLMGMTFGMRHLMELDTTRSLGLTRLLAYRTIVPVVMLTNVVYLRALIVPSPAKRTLVLSLIAVAFSVASAALNAPSDQDGRLSLDAGVSMIWAVLPVAGATAASTIIQGLREKVQEAAQLGQYTLLEKIGEGGMGAVWKARHALLRRPTAIKLLPPERARPEDLARFEREVQLTSQLTHPSTVAIYDYGHTPDGVFYYAMEYVDGVDLQALVEEHGPQPPARVVHILMHIAGSLSEAHAIGLIHRDIKPGNVLLGQRAGGGDVVKVVDFGLVKEIQGAGAAGITQADGVVGTPLYLPPEALRSPDSVDARADIYSVGAVGYFLLTGEAVFTGNTVIEICSHHLHTRPTPPSERLGRAVPEDLEQLILRCLEKDPSARPGDAARLRDRLAECEDAASWTDADAQSFWRERSARAAQNERAAIELTATVPVSLRDREASGRLN